MGGRERGKVGERGKGGGEEGREEEGKERREIGKQKTCGVR